MVISIINACLWHPLLLRNLVLETPSRTSCSRRLQYAARLLYGGVWIATRSMPKAAALRTTTAHFAQIW